MIQLHPANLWIGPEQELKERAVLFVQQHLCPEKGCGTCYRCKAIVERQHHALTWLVPENYYTVKQIQELFTKVCFSLQPGEKYFIIIERADLLNTASANCLLKSLEEPSEGYHYLLLAPRVQGILPTIKSRCVTEQLSSGEPVTHRLLEYFTSYSFSRAPALMKEIEKERIPEKEIDQLLDAILHHWHNERKQVIEGDGAQRALNASSILDIIQEVRLKPPMPGSSKLFLKNLYLRMALAL